MDEKTMSCPSPVHVGLAASRFSKFKDLGSAVGVSSVESGSRYRSLRKESIVRLKANV
jgi:hypothetical protein